MESNAPPHPPTQIARLVLHHQAVGIVMEKEGCDATTAERSLVDTAERSGSTVDGVAATIVEAMHRHATAVMNQRMSATTVTTARRRPSDALPDAGRASLELPSARSVSDQARDTHLAARDAFLDASVRIATATVQRPGTPLDDSVRAKWGALRAAHIAAMVAHELELVRSEAQHHECSRLVGASPMDASNI